MAFWAAASLQVLDSDVASVASVWPNSGLPAPARRDVASGL